jgi:hypothetical protein
MLGLEKREVFTSVVFTFLCKNLLNLEKGKEGFIRTYINLFWALMYHIAELIFAVIFIVAPCILKIH